MDNNNNNNSSALSQNELEAKEINDKIGHKEKENNYSSSINNNESNKMRDDLKSYIMDHRRKIYQRIEGMEQEEELSLHNDQIYLNKPHYGNIGSNIVLFNKYVFGIKQNLILFIITIIGISLTWFGWVFTCGNFYSIKLYIICGISYFLTIFFMILSFIIEPGIIPRKCPDFSKVTEDSSKNNKNNDLKEEEKQNDKVKDNIQENEKENNNKEDEGNIIPKIFKERECITCNIIRPPGASHCRICDNCIQDFDHHCYYISNCVGKRNHKYFYFFLFFGSICGMQVSLFSLITIYNLFIIKFKETIFILYKGNKYLFILSMSLMILGLFSVYCDARNVICLILFPLIGFCIFTRMWYKYIYILNNLPKYYNPFILIVFISAIYLCNFVTSTFIGQTIFISSGYTLKQSTSIQNEMIELSLRGSNNKINKEYTRNKTFKERINNIINFLKADIGKSLIVPERDLIK